MSTLAGVVAVLLLMAALVLVEVKKAVDQCEYWERDEHEDGGP